MVVVVRSVVVVGCGRNGEVSVGLCFHSGSRQSSESSSNIRRRCHRSNYLFRLLHLDTVQRGDPILHAQIHSAQHFRCGRGRTSHFLVVLLAGARRDLLHLEGEWAQLEIALDCREVILDRGIGILPRDLHVAHSLQSGQTEELTLRGCVHLTCALFSRSLPFFLGDVFGFGCDGDRHSVFRQCPMTWLGFDYFLGTGHGAGQGNDHGIVVALQDLIQVGENVIYVVVERLVLDKGHRGDVLRGGWQFRALFLRLLVSCGSWSFLLLRRSSMSSKRITKDLNISVASW